MFATWSSAWSWVSQTYRTYFRALRAPRATTASSALVLFALLVRGRRAVTVVGLRPELMTPLTISGLRGLLHFSD